MPMQQKIHSCLDQRPQDAAATQIRTKLQMVASDERAFGVLSSGERIAVALVLDRYDLIQRAWGTIAEAIDRLGPLWTAAALRVQRDGWEQERTTP